MRISRHYSVASEGFEPPKAEPADLQLSGERLIVGQIANVPQYFIGQATLCRYAHFRPFPSVERNLNGMWLPGNARIVELEFDYGSAFFS
jgi:hypothetical protein